MVKQELYGDIKFDNRERDCVIMTQKQGLGSFNIIFIERQHLKQFVKHATKILNKKKNAKKS